MKTSFLKKLKLFLSYRKIIKSNKSEILQKFGFRIDNANRLYTVLNVPEELVGEAYSLKKSDIDTISQNFIREFAKETSTFLNTKD
jgi:disulfide oxidoreductase YuzD